MKHTPTPWAIDPATSERGQITIKSANGMTVARVPFATEKQLEAGLRNDDGDAKLIVAACNSRAELVAAAKEAKSQIQNLLFHINGNEWNLPNDARNMASYAERKLTKAIELAEQE